MCSQFVLTDCKAALQRALASPLTHLINPVLHAAVESASATHAAALMLHEEDTSLDAAYKQTMKLFWEQVFALCAQGLKRQLGSEELPALCDYSAQAHSIMKRNPYVHASAKTAIIQTRLLWLSVKRQSVSAAVASTATESSSEDTELQRLQAYETSALFTVFVETVFKHSLGMLCASPARMFQYSPLHESYQMRGESIEDAVTKVLPQSIHVALDHFAGIAKLAAAPDNLDVPLQNGSHQNASHIPPSEPSIPLVQHRSMLERVHEDFRATLEQIQSTMGRQTAVITTVQQDLVATRSGIEVRLASWDAKTSALQAKCERMEAFIQGDMNKTFSQLQAFHAKLSKDFDTHKRSVESMLDTRAEAVSALMTETRATVEQQLRVTEDRLAKRMKAGQESSVQQFNHWFSAFGEDFEALQDMMSQCMEAVNELPGPAAAAAAVASTVPASTSAVVPSSPTSAPMQSVSLMPLERLVPSTLADPAVDSLVEDPAAPDLANLSVQG